MEGAARVIAIERDGRCLPALQAISDAYPGRLTIVHGDALETDLAALVGPDRPAAIVANLPYNVATLLLVGWLEADVWPSWWDRMVLMFQKEVAQRLVAEPNSKAYGRLSVLTQYRAVPRIRMTPAAAGLHAGAQGRILRRRDRARALPAPPCPIKALARITAAGFGQRRKMLRSSLQTITPFAELLAAARRHRSAAPRRDAERGGDSPVWPAALDTRPVEVAPWSRHFRACYPYAKRGIRPCGRSSSLRPSSHSALGCMSYVAERRLDRSTRTAGRPATPAAGRHQDRARQRPLLFPDRDLIVLSIVLTLLLRLFS